MKKNYARYIYNRGLVVLWRGDPAEAGAIHRSIALVTSAFNSSDSLCQVYELQGIGKGVADGKFAGTEGEPIVRFDKDFNTLEEGAAQGKALVKQAEAEGFRQMTIWDQIEFEERARNTLGK